MSKMQIIECAAYIGPYTPFGWITTLAVICIGIFLFIFVYKVILKNLKGPKEDEDVNNEKIPIVVEKETPIDENGITKLTEKEEDIEAEEVIVTPMSGRLMSIVDVPDPVFSEKMVGEGFAIEMNKSDIYSPVNGKVMQIYSNKDALTIKSNAGRDVILHIGLDTSGLRGEGITFNVKEGDDVQAGDRIGKVNLEVVVPKVSSIISPVVFPSLPENEHVVVKQKGMVEARMKNIIVIELD